MTVLRTPDERFENLPDFPFEPNYLQIQDPDFGALRIHFLDEGPADGAVVLCMHGEPTWSYLYRKMIPLFVEAGFRVIAPDLVGFGRSDKLPEREDYTYARHVAWMTSLLEGLDLLNVTCSARTGVASLVCGWLQKTRSGLLPFHCLIPVCPPAIRRCQRPS